MWQKCMWCNSKWNGNEISSLKLQDFIGPFISKSIDFLWIENKRKKEAVKKASKTIKMDIDRRNWKTNIVGGE